MFFGYVFAQPCDVKDYEIRFIHETNPGYGLNPDGMITGPHGTLMVARKEIAQGKHDHAYAKRRSAREMPNVLTPEQMAERGLK